MSHVENFGFFPYQRPDTRMTRRMLFGMLRFSGLSGSCSLLFSFSPTFPTVFHQYRRRTYLRPFACFGDVFVRFSLTCHPRGRTKTTRFLCGNLRFWSHLFVRFFLPFTRPPAGSPFHGKGTDQANNRERGNRVFCFEVKREYRVSRNHWYLI